MRPSFALSTLCGVLGALLIAPYAAAQKAAAEPELPKPFVVRYQGSQMGSYFGKPAMIITGVHAIEGKAMQLPIPPSDWNATKYVANEDMAAAVKNLKPGDYIKVETEVRNYKPWLKNLDPYEVVAGEEVPGNFVFFEGYSRNEGGQDVYFVTLTKYGQFIDAVLPNVRNEQKQMAPDAALMARASEMKKGDVVEASLAAGPGKYALIKEIEPYSQPQEGTMGKVVTTEENGQKKQVVEIEAGGSTLSLPVAGKTVRDRFTPDARVLASAQRIKAGTAVLYRTRTEGGQQYLKAIEPAPKKKEEPPAKK